MKKIINAPETLVIDMCLGMAEAHPELVFDPKYKVIRRREINNNKVSLISGGGSGHEPAHAGFVGAGMLDAAVCGDVFASPSQIQVLNGIKAAATDAGVLLIIKNYSGDRMNFDNAAAMAREDGIKVESVYVNDDIAVKDSLYTVGRRGVAGTVFVHKIAGAAAEQGRSLAEVKAVAEKVIANVRTLGFALTSCTVPAKGSPTFAIGDGEMEFGVGIHGEPGRSRELFRSADDIAARMVDDLIADLGLKANDEIALLVNGLGGTPLQELYLLSHAVTARLKAANIRIFRTFVGNYMTSIDMAGASVSLLKTDDALKSYLDYPATTPAFVRAADKAVAAVAQSTRKQADPTADKAQVAGVKADKAVFGATYNTGAMVEIIDKMADIIIANEVHFCEMDSVAGDGDFGMSIAKGFRQLKSEWDSRNQSSIGEFLKSCSEVITEYCGGASGPIWGSAFRGAGKAAGNVNILDAAGMGKLLGAAVKAVQEVGERSFGRGAVVGDKTLIDALVPCADAVTRAAQAGKTMLEALTLGAQAAVDGAESTKKIAARMGRAGTVGERSIGHPDAGAYGLGVIFTEIVKHLSAK